MLLLCELSLRCSGITNVICCEDSRDVAPLLAKRDVSVVILDLRMPPPSGHDLLRLIHHDYPHIPVIILTGSNDLDTAVECMRMGALDYLVKPVEDSRLTASVRQALKVWELQGDCAHLRESLLSQQSARPEALTRIVTNNTEMFRIFRYLEAVAKTPRPVLITGETGVGKDLIAQAVHGLSERQGRFIAINAAGLDDNLFSDTLFGHRKGAFTGASEHQRGVIEQAAGGTLFLDEIGDLSPASQIKLLRLIQEGEYFVIGNNSPSRSDARIVVATNCDLEELQNNSHFRKDLYYRLKTHQVHVPALRDRMDDVPLLLEHFIHKASKILGKKLPTAPPELVTLLSTYHFPGNVRELESMVFDAVSSHRAGVLSLASFREHMGLRGASYAEETSPKTAGEDMTSAISAWPKLPTLRSAAQILIKEALHRAKGNQSVAAGLLGISPPSLNRRLKRKKS